jgi:hypothetical protein
MGQMLQWSLNFPANGFVSLYGNPVPAEGPLEVYPGLFWVSTYLPGTVQYETVTYVSQSGSWSPPAGQSISSVQALQDTFALGATAGASFLVILVAGVPQFLIPQARRVRPEPDRGQEKD